MPGVRAGAQPRQQARGSELRRGLHRIHRGCEAVSHPRSSSTTVVHDATLCLMMQVAGTRPRPLVRDQRRTSSSSTSTLRYQEQH
jgi:hypothetical protein